MSPHQVGGLPSHFLLSKDGRKPLPADTLKALLPTEKEAPKLKSSGGEEAGEKTKEGEEGKVAAANGSLKMPPGGKDKMTNCVKYFWMLRTVGLFKCVPETKLPNGDTDDKELGIRDEDTSTVGKSDGDGGDDLDDSGSLFGPDPGGRRVSAVQTQYCGAFKRSPVCAIV